MSKNKIIWIVVAILVVIIVCLLVFRNQVGEIFNPSPSVTEPESARYYDESYGYFDELTGTFFEYAKPEYYQKTNFGETVFPEDERLACYFPAFIAMDGVNFSPVPEDIIRKYFDSEYADYIISLREEVEWDEGETPISGLMDIEQYYSEILVTELEYEKTYRVHYSCANYYYVKYFEKTEEGKFYPIENPLIP